MIRGKGCMRVPREGPKFERFYGGTAELTLNGTFSLHSWERDEAEQGAAKRKGPVGGPFQWLVSIVLAGDRDQLTPTH